MEPTTTSSKTTPRDFFLWAGAMVALYGSVISFITLLFEYVNTTFPDPLAYSGDPYAGAVRSAMAALIVLVPLTLILLRVIRNIIAKEPGKAQIWVRRWALVLTLFVAGATIAIDLITLINTFLGGEISTRFLLKVLVVLLVSGAVFLHFFADLKGYWIENVKKANLVGIAVGLLSLIAIGSGFFIIGTPNHLRDLRADEQKVNDLMNIQSQIITYYQQKEALPASLEELVDPLSGFSIPVDAETGVPYSYTRTNTLSFTLCASFNAETPDTKGQGAYPARDIAYPSMLGGENDTWKHGTGEVCFSRTIDPERYPVFEKAVR